MRHVGIVMAAGSGRRMQIDKPKQFLLLEGKPILYYSLKAMQDSFLDEIILATRAEDILYVKEEIVDRYGLTKVSKIVPGGAERYDSVWEGLQAVAGDSQTYVYIHDGARPFLNYATMERIYGDVLAFGATVAAVPSKDTVKIAGENGVVTDTPDRSTVWIVQTPQAFSYPVIYDAYRNFHKNPEPGITDDAMIVERYSDTKVHVTMADYSNIKITTSEDLTICSNFLKKS